MKGVIFRRIKGRIVAISRDKLRAKIAARTSLSEKRIKAIRAARHHHVANQYHRDFSSLIGSGSYASVFKAKGFKGYVIKQTVARGIHDPKWHQKDMLRRFITKNILKKHAPETFLVRTKNKSFIVQKRAKPFFKNKSSKKFWDIWNEMDEFGIKKGIEVHDLHKDNLGIIKKKTVIIDTGNSEFLRKAPLILSQSERNRIKKFLIKSKRNK